jgi:choline transport protein
MEKGIGLRAMNEDGLRVRDQGSISDSKGQDFDQDRYDLARVGKKQVLKVGSKFRCQVFD